MDLTLDKLIATLAECGCCPPPGCCPPVVECRSLLAEAHSTGFVDPDFSDSTIPYHQQTRYLRHVLGRAGVAPPSVTSDYPDLSGTFTSSEYTVSWSHYFIQEYNQGFEVFLCGEIKTEPEFSYRCEISGGWTERYYGTFWNGTGYTVYLGYMREVVMSDAEGEETEYHIEWRAQSAAWDAAHPDYPAEVAAYEVAYAVWQAAYDAWQATYYAWVTTYNDWDAGGQIGPAPEEPAPFTDVEPTLADPRPEEPEEFYGPCTQKNVTTITIWDEVEGEIVLRESTEEEPNPVTYTNYSNGSGGLGDIPFAEWEDRYEAPVTYAEFLSLVDAWIASNADSAFDNGSDPGCVTGTACTATKQIGTWVAAIYMTAVYQQFFQYRFKLNKCCVWQDIRSEWDTVFYPQAWLDWKAAADLNASDVDPAEPPRPVKNPRAWTWTGTPPRCPESSSTSSDSTVLDPYDYEPMWSPWSATIMVPAGEYEGIVVNRNYQQKCYEAPPQEFPDLFGTYDTSSES